MGKPKSKHTSKSESIINKKSTNKTKSSNNPFEVQVSREKFQVLNREARDGKGRPGVSRGKAMKRRVETLGVEYANRHKTNTFKDKRIGGFRKADDEDLLNARYTAEKLSQFQSKKQMLFNLNDDVVLTHKGQTLEEIEQFYGGNSDVDSEEDEGILDENFTEMANFGGDGRTGENDAQNRKSAIDELILESKKRKIEKLKEKEEVESMTNMLDEKWKTLIPLVGKMSGNHEKPKQDAYDRAMREMIFEPRGEVSDRLLPPEEAAKKEKERLDKLERERLARMRGEENDETGKLKHRSADDLDDGYVLGRDNDAVNNQILAYPLNGESPIVEPAEEIEETNAEEEVDEEEEENGEDDDDDEEDENESFELDDLKYKADSSEDDDDEHEKPSKSHKETKEKVVVEIDSKLPFTFEVPRTYDAFSALIEPHASDQQILIIDRMVKSNHPRAAQEGKDKYATILTYLLQLIDDTFSEATELTVKANFKFLSALAPIICQIASVIPDKTTFYMKEIIKEKQEEYKKKKRSRPSVEVLVFIKLISLIFPTSDFRHEVVTPTFVFMSQMLTTMKIKTRTDISRGLFLVSLYLEFATLSTRVLPAAVVFLLGTLFLAIKKRSIGVFKVIPPFTVDPPFNSLLVYEETNESLEKHDLKLIAEDLCAPVIDDSFKVRALNSAVTMGVDLFENILTQSPSAPFYAQYFEERLDQIDADVYPSAVQNSIAELTKLVISAQATALQYIRQEKRQRPKILRQIEPKFEKVYDGMKKFKPMTKEKEEQQKLLHKVKRETKGAIREIRRDNEFLAKMKMRQQMKSDAERREKVKRIYAEASVQQGELNAFDRIKNKKKK